MTTTRVPHIRVVVAVCAVAVFGYGVFSVWIVARDADAALIGDIIGTWKSFAVAAIMFWIGSSSAGKAKDEDQRPTGTPTDPVSVEDVRG